MSLSLSFSSKNMVYVLYLVLLCIPSIGWSQKIDDFNSEAKSILKDKKVAAVARLQTLIERNKGSADTVQLEVFEAAYDYSLRLREKTLSYHIALYVGTQFYQRLDLENALVYAEKAMQHAYNEGSKYAPYNLQGLLYLRVNDYELALEHLFLSVETATLLDNGSEVIPLEHISRVYTEMNDMENAIKYRLQTIPIIQKMATPDKEYHLASQYTGLANAYSQKGLENSMAYYFGLADTILTTNPKISIKADVYPYFYASMLSHYLEQKQFDKVKLILAEAQEYISLNEIDIIVPRIKCELYQGEFAEAYVLLSELNTRENLPFEEQDEVYKANIAYYEATGDLKNVVNFQEKSYQLQEEQLEADRLRLIAFAGTKYKTTKKENEIQLLKIRQTAQRNRQLFLFIILIVVLIIAGAGIFAYRQSQKRNLLLNKDLDNKAIIEQQAEELRQMDKVKSRFFANISHELRTPLTLLLGPVNSVLNNPKIQSEDEHLLHIAQKSGQQLNGMINQILDLTKIEANKLELHEKEVPIFDWFNQLTANFTSLSSYNNINYQIENHLNAQRLVLVDNYKLSIILKNLLSNAFKFSSENGTVAVKAEIDGQIIFTVQDTGRGIHPQDLPYIFDRYFQSNLPNAMIEGGTGIGLAITKEFATLMGGTVSVESVWHEGSTFTVQIPNKVIGQVRDNTAIEAISDSSRVFSITDNYDKNLQNILIVEDNLDICAYLQTILSPFYNIKIAHNGMEAIKILSRNKEGIYEVDLIISDIMMPIMDGFQLIERLKSSDNFSQIPIIMLTARSSSTDKLKALRIGVDDYLLKPFNEEELLTRIENLLKNDQVRKEYRESIADSTEMNASSNSSKTLPTVTIASKSYTVKNQEEMEWLELLKANILKSMGDIHLTTSQIALEMSLSNSQLLRKVKSLTGLTTMQLIQEVRFLESRKLLEQRTYSTVKVVAYTVGFKDEKNFSRNFKKRFGKNPSSYLEV